jgi:ferredoxin-fold anticodon binding domain-containing protein
MSNKKSIFDDFIGKYCIIRTYSAGVHVGYVEACEETRIVLSESRRIWSWAGAFTLSEIAVNGLNYMESRIAIEVPRILLTEAIETIEVSNQSRETIDKTHE